MLTIIQNNVEEGRHMVQVKNASSRKVRTCKKQREG